MLPLSTPPSPLCSCSFKQTLLSCAFSLSHFLADSLSHSLTLSITFFLALRVAYLWLSHFANGISFYDKWLVIIKVARSAVFGPAAKSPLARLLLLQRNDLRMRKREREYECKWEQVQKVNNVQQALLALPLPLPLLSCRHVLLCCFLSYGWMTFAKCLRAVLPVQARPAGNERQKENNTKSAKE